MCVLYILDLARTAFLPNICLHLNKYKQKGKFFLSQHMFRILTFRLLLSLLSNYRNCFQIYLFNGQLSVLFIALQISCGDRTPPGEYD